MQQIKHGLRKGDDVTTALYEAGFGSPSRLYEKSPQHLGMTPGAYRRGGAGMTMAVRHRTVDARTDAGGSDSAGPVCCAFRRHAATWSGHCGEEFHAATLSATRAALRDYDHRRRLCAWRVGHESNCRSTYVVRHFQRVWDELRGSPAVKLAVTGRWPTLSATTRQYEQWRVRARPIRWRWRCRVIAWFASDGELAGTAGG